MAMAETTSVADIELPLTALNVECTRVRVPAEKNARSRRRRGGKKDAANEVVNSEAVIDAAIPHPLGIASPSRSSGRRARPLPVEATTAAVQRAGGTQAPLCRFSRMKTGISAGPHPKPHHMKKKSAIAGHGLGDHLPAFPRRLVCPRGGDRRTGK